MRPSPRSLMEFAEWRLIIVSHSKCVTLRRFSHSRSYLSCHHFMIACAIGVLPYSTHLAGQVAHALWAGA